MSSRSEVVDCSEVCARFSRTLRPPASHMASLQRTLSDCRDKSYLDRREQDAARS